MDEQFFIPDSLIGNENFYHKAHKLQKMEKLKKDFFY